MAAQKDPASVDASVPNAARMYDYWLGGKDNFAADREAADRSALAVPQLPWLARQNREFLGRAVRFCANAGITQFLDIGSGLPTMDNVHEVAGRVTAQNAGDQGIKVGVVFPQVLRAQIDVFLGRKAP